MVSIARLEGTVEAPGVGERRRGERRCGSAVGNGEGERSRPDHRSSESAAAGEVDLDFEPILA